jgi:hypothetical protein
MSKSTWRPHPITDLWKIDIDGGYSSFDGINFKNLITPGLERNTVDTPVASQYPTGPGNSTKTEFRSNLLQ